MGNDSSRARRRESVRRPIPATRLSAGRSTADTHTDLTEQYLVDGWPLEPGLRVRLARGEDMPAVRELSTLAGVNLETEVVDAVASDIAAAGLHVAVRAGHDAFLRHIAEQLFAHQGGDQTVPAQHVMLVLVAEHDDQGIVGTAVAYPPVGLLQQLLKHSQRTGGNSKQAAQILYSGILAIVRIKVLAVADGMRGRGIGSALLQRCRQIYDHAGYMIVYGQAQDTPQLGRFYRRHGFDVLAPGAGFDPWVAFGVHAEVRPGSGERTFIRRRPSKSERQRRRPAPG